jgi:hypothetical protein
VKKPEASIHPHIFFPVVRHTTDAPTRSFAGGGEEGGMGGTLGPRGAKNTKKRRRKEERLDARGPRKDAPDLC